MPELSESVDERLPAPDFSDPAVVRPLRNRRRTGVLGLSRSGKTTFLVSIIDRIWRLDETQRTKLGLLGVTSHVQQLPPIEEQGGFPYKFYREYYRVQEWPDKTVASSEYAYRLYHTGRGALSKVYSHLYAEERTFIDISGERLADFTMAGRTYAAWSDWLLARFDDKRYRSLCREYLDLFTGGELNAADVLAGYKRLLAQLARRMLPLVCPSTFLVHPEGLYPRGGDEAAHDMPVEKLAARGLCGLDEARQFAPLSAAARGAAPQLAKTFARNFDAYRKEIADPLARAFYDCDDLLVLVDVAAILAGGPEAYYGTRWALQMMLASLNPGHTRAEWFKDLAKSLITGLRGRTSRIRRLGFVATKADLVHSHDRVNLRTLLRDMTADLLTEARLKKRLDVGYFYCAAVAAGRDGSEYPRIKGWARRDHEPEYVEFPISPVPREWPAESEWGPFLFASPEPPKLDLLGRRPFPSIGLEEILEFIGCKEAARFGG
jgi:predicted YcjX-like family ATPase